MKIVHDMGLKNPSDVETEAAVPDSWDKVPQKGEIDSDSAIVDLRQVGELESFVQKAMKMETYDDARIASIRDSIAAGVYKPDLEGAAARLVEESLVFADLDKGEA